MKLRQRLSVPTETLTSSSSNSSSISRISNSRRRGSGAGSGSSGIRSSSGVALEPNLESKVEGVVAEEVAGA